MTVRKDNDLFRVPRYGSTTSVLVDEFLGGIGAQVLDSLAENEETNHGNSSGAAEIRAWRNKLMRGRLSAKRLAAKEVVTRIGAGIPQSVFFARMRTNSEFSAFVRNRSGSELNIVRAFVDLAHKDSIQAASEMTGLVMWGFLPENETYVQVSENLRIHPMRVLDSIALCAELIPALIDAGCREMPESIAERVASRR